MFGQLPEPDRARSVRARWPTGCGRARSTRWWGRTICSAPPARSTRMLERGSLASLILWGPPGCGKTTIARLLAARSGLHFVQLSAVFSGVADLKRAFDEAARRRRTGQGTLLFVDEIHRFNRAQQDGFLPVVETGTITLIGATTENPSFALNGALLSRCQVLVLRRLDDAALELLLARAEAEIGRALPLDAEARATLRAMADGDGRYVLNMAEQIVALPADTPVMDPRRARRTARPARRAVRQGPRGALQSDLRAAQVVARLRSRCGALLVRAHAERRRGSPLHRPPPGAFRSRGYRHGRPERADPGAGGLGNL